MKKCQQCKKILDNDIATHCSDECLLKSIKKSKSMDGSNEWKVGTTWLHCNAVYTSWLYNLDCL